MRNPNVVWKDTVLIPAGDTVDILFELFNPGKWMLHCHIAEHLEAGMKTVLEVPVVSKRIPVVSGKASVVSREAAFVSCEAAFVSCEAAFVSSHAAFA